MSHPSVFEQLFATMATNATAHKSDVVLDEDDCACIVSEVRKLQLGRDEALRDLAEAQAELEVRTRQRDYWQEDRQKLLQQLEESDEISKYWEQRSETERAQRQKEIGMQEYRGNTISYIYDKEQNYSGKFAEMRTKLADANNAIDVLDNALNKIPEEYSGMERGDAVSRMGLDLKEQQARIAELGRPLEVHFAEYRSALRQASDSQAEALKRMVAAESDLAAARKALVEIKSYCVEQSEDHELSEQGFRHRFAFLATEVSRLQLEAARAAQGDSGKEVQS